MAKKKTNKIEKIFLIVGVLLVISVASLVIYSLVFLSGEMLGAFTASQPGGEIMRFDIEGFDKLGL